MRARHKKLELERDKAIRAKRLKAAKATNGSIEGQPSSTSVVVKALSAAGTGSIGVETLVAEYVDEYDPMRPNSYEKCNARREEARERAEAEVRDCLDDLPHLVGHVRAFRPFHDGCERAVVVEEDGHFFPCSALLEGFEVFQRARMFHLCVCTRQQRVRTKGHNETHTHTHTHTHTGHVSVAPPPPPQDK